MNYVNGLLNKRSDNTKLGLADLVGVNDDEYKLMFENIENDPDEPNEKPKIRLVKLSSFQFSRNHATYRGFHIPYLNSVGFHPPKRVRPLDGRLHTTLSVELDIGKTHPSLHFLG